MKKAEMSKFERALWRVVGCVAVFLGCMISVFMMIVSATIGTESFYTDNIISDKSKQVASDSLRSYFEEISNQTTIPLESFLEGYDDEDLVELMTLRAQDTAALILEGTPYPYLRAAYLCDFKTPLLAFVDEISSEYTRGEAEQMREEVNSIAEEGLRMLDNKMNVLNLSALADMKILNLVRPILKNGWIISANAVLFTAVAAYFMWKYLYKGDFWHGGYVTLSSLWLASAVPFSVAITFCSLKMASRLPLEKSSPLYYAAVNLINSFESIMMWITAAVFVGLLIVLLIVIWFYSAPKKSSGVSKIKK